VEVWFNPSCSTCRVARHELDDADVWIRLLAERPQLIQRPLVLTDDGQA
jgi:arsenate reductase-like glutaredoxin family protein